MRRDERDFYDQVKQSIFLKYFSGQKQRGTCLEEIAQAANWLSEEVRSCFHIIYE